MNFPTYLYCHLVKRRSYLKGKKCVSLEAKNIKKLAKPVTKKLQNFIKNLKNDFAGSKHTCSWIEYGNSVTQ
jgi:hypothetical protein